MSQKSLKFKLKEPLIQGDNFIENSSQEISSLIESLTELVRSLDQNESALGSNHDTPSLRSTMRQDIAEIESSIKKIQDLFKSLDSFTPKERKDIETKSKILRRSKDVFEKEKTNFNKILKNIKTSYRDFFVDQKPFHVSKNPTKPTVIEMNQDIQFKDEGLDIYELSLKEREQDVQEIRRLAKEMNLHAQSQATKVKEQTQEIQLIENYTADTNQSVTRAAQEIVSAQKYARRSMKKSLTLCLIVFTVCSLTLYVLIKTF